MTRDEIRNILRIIEQELIYDYDKVLIGSKVLDTTQKGNNSNTILAVRNAEPDGVCREYVVTSHIDNIYIPELEPISFNTSIVFQKGSENDESFIGGVLDSDLLEIVRDRLEDIQKNNLYFSEYNDKALHHINEALRCINKGAEERLNRKIEYPY